MSDLLMEKGVEDLSFDFEKIWKMKVPPRVTSFLWMLALGRLPTIEFFERRGIQFQQMRKECPWCDKELEIVDHLFFKCWLKFNECGVVFEDKAGGGGVLKDEDGVARELLLGSSEAKDAELAELKSIRVALELYEGMGWATCCPLLIEIGSNVVFKWLSETESRPRKLHYFFAEIERRSYLTLGKAEQMGNEMAFAPASGESVEEKGSIGV
ncbi:hypothetical protein PVK06_010143 [Gossypium arboreum]|uniref:Reverse transcriptase zinc-binding domain-containing protein n=1 Tax=Gossypium arboreum TaxID=29729 RepID=A0ABR0QQG0_GOSAR|nr:hypothetical protein PVK06_010143 [Gossypium arboreum]